jgi:heme exporter protein B
MTGFLAVIGRELRLSFRQSGELATPVLFFLMVVALFPFAIGPDSAVLARLAPGIVWTAALLAMLLGFDRLFRDDAADGSLALYRHAAIPLEAVIAAKVIAHWLMSAGPLILVSPLIAVLLSMPLPAYLTVLATLLLGTPALTALGACSAAATVTLRRGGLLAPVLMLPLATPVLIFGVGAVGSPGTAPLLFLAAFSLVACALSPFLAALALRMGDD